MVALTACSLTNTTTGPADINKLGDNKNTKSTYLRLRSADLVAAMTMQLAFVVSQTQTCSKTIGEIFRRIIQLRI